MKYFIGFVFNLILSLSVGTSYAFSASTGPNGPDSPDGQGNMAVTIPAADQAPEFPAPQERPSQAPVRPRHSRGDNGGGESHVIERALIKEAVTEKEEEKQIALNFRGVALKDAVNFLCQQSKVNIIIDKDVDQAAAVTATYSGISVEDALKSILTGHDIAFSKISGAYLVSPWEERYLDVNKLFLSGGGGSGSGSTGNTGTGTSGTANTSTGGTSGSMSTGSAQAGQTGNSSSGGGSGGSDFGGYIDNMVANLTKIMSGKGVITYMPTGFIYVKDSPSRIRAVEKTLEIDNAKRDSINIKITLLRIDYKDKLETGVNWSQIIGGKTGTSGLKLELGTNFSGNFASDSVASLKVSNPAETLSAVIKALSQYGDVSIAHSWEARTMSGTTIPFELTQTVWYSTGSTIQVINSQTITTPQMASQEIGLKITLNPLKYEDKYLVNTRIDMSSLIGYQKIGTIDLPNLEKNFLTIPIKMAMGDTVAISGFKIKSTDKQNIGLPFLSKIPILSSLFGYVSTENKTSEFTVLISFAPGPVYGFGSDGNKSSGIPGI